MKRPNFFIAGPIRTGTTALANILDTATNADVTVEKGWYLQYYTPSFYKMPGFLNTDKIYKETIEPLARKSNKKGRIYGDKHEAYIPWITHLDEPVILTIRNGYDTVRSMMNWHDELGWIYPEADYFGQHIAPIKEGNLSDMGRIRPRVYDRWYKAWADFDRFECCCWYWSRMTDWSLDLMGASRNFMIVSMDHFNELDVIRLFRSLGLEGYNNKTVNEMIHRRINSVETRFRKSPKFPKLDGWTKVQLETFLEIAGETQRRVESVSKRLFLKKAELRDELEKGSWKDDLCNL